MPTAWVTTSLGAASLLCRGVPGSPSAASRCHRVRAAALLDANMNKEAELTRLKVTFSHEMAHPEGAQLGIGDVSTERLASSIKMLSESKKLKRTPEAGEIFTREFLPPIAERITSLG